MKSLVEYITEKQHKESWGKAIFVVYWTFGNVTVAREEHTASMVASNYASFRNDNEFLVYCIKTKNFEKDIDKLCKLTYERYDQWKNKKLDELNNSNEEFEDVLEKEFGTDSFNKVLIAPKTKDELENAATELADKLL